jgi:hypothetical protein
MLFLFGVSGTTGVLGYGRRLTDFSYLRRGHSLPRTSALGGSRSRTSAVSRFPGFLADDLNGYIASVFLTSFPDAVFYHFTQAFDLGISQMLYTNKEILSRAHPDQFIQLHLYRGVIPVLRVLDQKDHQESHNGRARIDHELPSV